MLLFSHTLRRYVWALPATFVVGFLVTMLWVPQPPIVPYPATGFIGCLEMILPVLLALPLSFLLHNKSTIELALVHGVGTLRLFAVHFASAMLPIITAIAALLLCYRYEPLPEDRVAQLTIPLHIPETLRLHMLLSLLVTLLFFVSLVVFLRVALRNCYVPIVAVLLTFTLFYEHSRSLRTGSVERLSGALFDPYISTYILGDTVPRAHGYGALWSCNRLLFFGIAAVLLAMAALILRREKMHE